MHTSTHIHTQTHTYIHRHTHTQSRTRTRTSPFERTMLGIQVSGWDWSVRLRSVRVKVNPIKLKWSLLFIFSCALSLTNPPLLPLRSETVETEWNRMRDSRGGWNWESCTVGYLSPASAVVLHSRGIFSGVCYVPAWLSHLLEVFLVGSLCVCLCVSV